MSVFSNVIKPQGLEPLQFPTKFRSHSWKILSRETVTKTMMTVRTKTGTEEQSVPRAQQEQQVLDDATTVQLARFGEQIEAHYDMPMDIEWAIADGTIAILQARPITSLPVAKPAPLHNVVLEPVAPNTIWMRRQIVEHMPDPLLGPDQSGGERRQREE